MAPGLYLGRKTVWMRALRAHTYEGRPIEEGAIYLAHDDPDNIANLEILHFAQRDTPPPTIARPEVPGAPAAVTTTRTWPKVRRVVNEP